MDTQQRNESTYYSWHYPQYGETTDRSSQGFRRPARGKRKTNRSCGIFFSVLVASNVDYLLAKRRWGIEFIDIPMEEVYCLFYQIKDDDIGYEASVFANRAIACREGTPEDLLKAMRLYQAVKIICEKKKLDAVTLSCFSLIEKLGTTGCLALALLNDEGIPAGCEGDLQSIFTLLIAKTLTGQAGFMANPAFINDDQNEIVMAHCTIATKWWISLSSGIILKRRPG